MQTKTEKKIIANNKKARYEYFLKESCEAGICLTGTEIKSIRSGKVNISDAYVKIDGNEATIINMNISHYDHGNIFNVDEKRPRKLLLHKKEILKMQQQAKEEGLTIIPLQLYLIEGKAKVEIALAKGKKNYDKRETIKRRDIERNSNQSFK